jgi:very-short-patch-repair endonuclease
MPDSSPKSNRKELKPLRKKLRKALTPAEARLWTYLQAKKLGGRKFRRQHSFGPYILDFFCSAENLAVELDGQTHDGPMAAKHDAERTAYLAQHGIEVIRFENKTVFEMPEALLNRIQEHFKEPPEASED